MRLSKQQDVDFIDDFRRDFRDVMGAPGFASGLLDELEKGVYAAPTCGDAGHRAPSKLQSMRFESRRNAKVEDQARMKLEAAAFRSLVEHFQQRTDVQNIDLMNLAGFCRNCIWKWYKAAADEQGIELTKEQAQEAIYGMPYAQWKRQYQHEATPEQLEKFEETRPLHSDISGHR